MSISIYSTASEKVQINEKCTMCVGFQFTKQKPCPHCGGENGNPKMIYEEEIRPCINWSQDNAEAIFRVLGINLGLGEGYGMIKNSKIPKLLRRVIKSYHSNLSHMIREPIEFPRTRLVDRSGSIPKITTSPRSIECGMSLESLQNKLLEFEYMLKYSKDHDADVIWG